MSLLTYLYTGQLTLPPFAKSELYNLSKVLDLPPLEIACDKLVCDRELSGDGIVNVDTDETVENEDFIESKIDLKEIWGESDSDSDDDNDNDDGRNTSSRTIGDNDNSAASNEESDIDGEDYREIMCTQLKRIKSIEYDGSVSVQDNGTGMFLKERTSRTEECRSTKAEIKNEVEIVKSEEDCDNLLVVTGENFTNSCLNIKECVREEDSDNSDVEIAYDERNKATSFRTGQKRSVLETKVNVSPQSKRMKISNTKTEVGPVGPNSFGSRNSSTIPESLTTVNKTSSATENITCNVSVNQLNVTDQLNMNLTCNTSLDLFGSPSPKKSPSQKAHLSLKSLQNVSVASTSIVSGIRKTDQHVHSSTPQDKCASSLPPMQSRISNIPMLMSPANKISESDSMDTDKYEKKSKCTKETRSEAGIVGARKHGTEDIVYSSDDDLQITGDNFDEIKEKEQSPVFCKTKISTSLLSQKLENIRRRESMSNYSFFDREHCRNSSDVDKSGSEGVLDQSNKSLTERIVNIEERNSQMAVSNSGSDEEIVLIETEGRNEMETNTNANNSRVSDTSVDKTGEENVLEMANDSFSMSQASMY